MDFALSEEQTLLAAMLRRFLEEECPVSRVRDLVAEEPGHDGGTWKALCELGVAGLLIPEEHGGSGLGLLDAAVAAESLAWGVAPCPFLGSAVMAPIAHWRAAVRGSRRAGCRSWRLEAAASASRRVTPSSVGTISGSTWTRHSRRSGTQRRW